MTTFANISNDTFRRTASDFFKSTNDLSKVSLDEVRAGAKCVTLHYFGASDDWTDRQINEAVIIIDLANRREIEMLKPEWMRH